MAEVSRIDQAECIAVEDLCDHMRLPVDCGDQRASVAPLSGGNDEDGLTATAGPQAGGGDHAARDSAVRNSFSASNQSS